MLKFELSGRSLIMRDQSLKCCLIMNISESVNWIAHSECLVEFGAEETKLNRHKWKMILLILNVVSYLKLKSL